MIYTNSGLKMAMESVRGSALTISGVTQAAPGVVSSTANGLANGDIVFMEISGMDELDKRLFVVANAATDTFELMSPDGVTSIDTTLYDTFISGTASLITFGTTIAGVQEFSPSGGDPKFVDTTTVLDKSDKQQVNGASAMSYGLTMQWDPADTAQLSMIEASRLSANKCFKITWPNGRFVLFSGSVGYKGAPGGSSQGVTTSPAAIAMGGDPTYGI